jgi:hypothetical protein
MLCHSLHPHTPSALTHTPSQPRLHGPFHPATLTSLHPTIPCTLLGRKKERTRKGDGGDGGSSRQQAAAGSSRQQAAGSSSSSRQQQAAGSSRQQQQQQAARCLRCVTSSLFERSLRISANLGLLILYFLKQRSRSKASSETPHSLPVS